MESDDSLPILTDLDFIFPTLTPSALEQPAEPIVPLLSPPSISIPSNPASPDEQSDTASTTRGLSSVTGYSVATFTTDQQPIPTIASSLETLNPRTHPLAVHANAHDLNESENCDDTPAETSKKETD